MMTGSFLNSWWRVRSLSLNFLTTGSFFVPVTFWPFVWKETDFCLCFVNALHPRYFLPATSMLRPRYFPATSMCYIPITHHFLATSSQLPRRDIPAIFPCDTPAIPPRYPCDISPAISPRYDDICIVATSPQYYHDIQ